MQSPLLGTSALPTEVTIGGRAFPIRHDFRTGIRFETLMFDQSVPEGMKVALAVGLYFETTPDADMGAVIDALLDFYRCGKPAVSEGSDEQLYSYTHDYDDIYAGFLQAYGIDLFETDYLHWWKFRAMLMALPRDSHFMEVVGYRAAKVLAGSDKEYRAHVRKMKRLYALPGESSLHPVRIRTQADLEAAIAAVEEAKRDAEGT